MKTSLFQICAALAAIAIFAEPVFADEARAAGGAGDSVKAAPAKVPEGIAKIKGEHWLIKNDQQTKIGKELTLPSGVKIGGEGRITLQNGVKVRLKDGQLVTFEGKVMDAPVALSSGAGAQPAGLTPQANVNLSERRKEAAAAPEKK